MQAVFTWRFLQASLRLCRWRLPRCGPRLLFTALMASFSTLLFANEPDANPENGVETYSLTDTTPTFYTGFAELMEDRNTLPVEELGDLETKIGRVALYHTEDRLYKRIPKPTETMIEGMIMKKLLDTGRFEVTECVECKLIKVSLADDQLKVSQAIESNQDLRNLARRLKVDGFFMWAANVYNDKFTIDMRLVDARDNKVIWTRQYARKSDLLVDRLSEQEKKKKFDRVDWEIFLGAWGFNATRRGTGVSSQSINSVTTFGFRRREQSDLYKDLSYGLGLEYFTNLSQSEYFDVSGVVIEGRVEVNIRALEQWLPTFMYLELGQALYGDSHSLLYKYGMDFPFTKNGYINLGVVYMRKEDIEWPSEAGLEASSAFGGASYDITLGFRF